MLLQQAILEKLHSPSYKPLSASELAVLIGCTEHELRFVLSSLEKEGRVIEGKKKCFALPEHFGIMRGRIQGTDRGFAFFIPENGGDDFFISPDNLNSALHNDIVLLKDIPSRKASRGQRYRPPRRREGEVLRIINRHNVRIVGTYEKNGRGGFVWPDEKRISDHVQVSREKSLNAVTGDKVVVVVDRWNQKASPEGHVTEIFGSFGDKKLDVLSVAKKYELEESFPAEVLRQASYVSVMREEDYQGRLDLREDFLVTIDGLDAKDLDDAVSLSRDEQGNFLLGVHIADVGHYVRANSVLDKEAWQRATSVYLPGMVIPMLPRELSNGICSLNAGEDRLALSCLMTIDAAGKVLEHRLAETVIRVAKRLDYGSVNASLTGESDTLAEILPLINEMCELTKLLLVQRLQRGALDFALPETKVVLADDGRVADIVKRSQGQAEQMIEEMMIIANETVATEYFYRDTPFLYRVHQVFGKEKLEDLNAFLAPFGYDINTRGGNVKSHHLQKVLAEIKDKPEEKLVSTVLLRSMNHAYYSNRALGHFALAAPYYSHFTAPIRRYPDLAIHRVIKTYLNHGDLKEDTVAQWREELATTALHSSRKEREAESAEREVVALKCGEYMSEHIGEYFDGHISGVTGYGFYVELENTVEGMVRLSDLSDDYYEYDELHYLLKGSRTKKIIRLGDSVRVRVCDVDREKGLISFDMPTPDDF